jgi:hypothetical protein
MVREKSASFRAREKKSDCVPRRVNMGKREPFIFECNINFISVFFIFLISDIHYSMCYKYTFDYTPPSLPCAKSRFAFLYTYQTINEFLGDKKGNVIRDFSSILGLKSNITKKIQIKQVEINVFKNFIFKDTKAK